MEKLVAEMNTFLKSQREFLTKLVTGSVDYRVAEEEIKDAEYVVATVKGDFDKADKEERLRRVFMATTSAEIYNSLGSIFPDDYVESAV